MKKAGFYPRYSTDFIGIILMICTFKQIKLITLSSRNVLAYHRGWVNNVLSSILELCIE